MNNRKLNLTLVSLYDSSSYGLRVLATFLSMKGYRVNQIYFKELYTPNFPYTDEEFNLLNDLIKKLDTDVLGISLRSSSFKTAIEISESVHEKLNIPVIMGGTHATLCPEECINYADIVCIGEGEYPLLELMENYTKDLNVKNIANLWIKVNGEIFKNPPRPLLENLDEVSIVDYSNDNKYLIEKNNVIMGEPLLNNSMVEIFSSRGCPFHCAYCSNNVLKKVLHKGRFVRQRSVENVIKELLYVEKMFKNLKLIVFGDEVFSFDKKWVSDFCKEYKDKVNLPFAAMFYPTLVDEDVVRMLTDAGLTHARTGIQSGSENIRKAIYNRNVSNEKIIESAIKFHRIGGIRLTFDTIVNNPYESENELKESLRFFLNIPRPFEMNLHSLVYFPKTELTIRALKDGIIKEEHIEGKYTHEALTLNHVLIKDKKMVYDYTNNLFWNCILSLTSKSFVPPSFILWLSESKYMKKYPMGVLYITKFANMLNIGRIVVHKLKNQEITFKDVFVGIRGFAKTIEVSK